MNVKCLRHFLKDLPDDMEVVTPTSDHSYQSCRQLELLEVEQSGKFFQDWDGIEKVQTANVVVIGW